MGCIYCTVWYILQGEISSGQSAAGGNSRVLFFLEIWEEVLRDLNDTIHRDSKLIGIKDKTKFVLRMERNDMTTS